MEPCKVSRNLPHFLRSSIIRNTNTTQQDIARLSNSILSNEAILEKDPFLDSLESFSSIGEMELNIKLSNKHVMTRKSELVSLEKLQPDPEIVKKLEIYLKVHNFARDKYDAKKIFNKINTTITMNPTTDEDIYDKLPVPKFAKQSKQPRKKRKGKNERIKNIKSTQESTLNELCPIPTSFLINKDKERVDRTRDSLELTRLNQLNNSSSYGRDKEATTFNDAFKSLPSTQELIMIADQALDKLQRCKTYSKNTSQIKEKSKPISSPLQNDKNQKSPNTTEDFITSRGGISNDKLQLNLEALRKDGHISKLINNLCLIMEQNIVKKSGKSKTALMDKDDENLYLDISDLGVEFSTLPGTQELFDWIKNGNTEELLQNAMDFESNDADINHFKARSLLRKNERSDNAKSDTFVKRVQDKKALPKDMLEKKSDSQELKSVDMDIKNFFKNIRPHSGQIKQRDKLYSDIPESTITKENKKIGKKNILQPPKPPVSSSFDQECAIEDLTNASLRRSPRTINKNNNSDPKKNSLNPLNIKKNGQKTSVVSNKMRKKLFTPSNDQIMEQIVHTNPDQKIRADQVIGSSIITEKTNRCFKKFSMQESKILLEILLEQNHFKNVKNDAGFWQTVGKLWLEKQLNNPIMSFRNGAALREIYYKKIMPNMNKYKLSEKEISLLKSYS